MGQRGLGVQDLIPDMVFTRTLFNSRGNGGRDKEGEGGLQDLIPDM